MVGALAPKADILVYFAPNTDAGFLDAIINASHATPAPASISISWGQNEDAWTAQARTAFDQALADATALGVTVTAAAGDNGSTDGVTDGKDHADFSGLQPARTGVRRHTNLLRSPHQGVMAAAGWDPCTGLGNPDGTALLAAIKSGF
ncbi:MULTISPECIES: hypothetical protein [unclassified Arthrobacter]|uniref:hypothetical protein n=1 Tax=unclassified Arthrobacter TaxID=235627 RepID=UPI0033994265